MQDAYIRSNEITEVALNKFRSTEYNKLLGCSDNVCERARAAQSLLDYLCGKFHIEGVELYVNNTPQVHVNNVNGKTISKTFGYYIPAYKTITIYNKTAKQQKVVSIKVFADTLLHEFMHHYDYTYLKLGDSLHTSGFYKRISDLQSKLK